MPSPQKPQSGLASGNVTASNEKREPPSPADQSPAAIRDARRQRRLESGIEKTHLWDVNNTPVSGAASSVSAHPTNMETGNQSDKGKYPSVPHGAGNQTKAPALTGAEDFIEIKSEYEPSAELTAQLENTGAIQNDDFIHTVELTLIPPPSWGSVLSKGKKFPDPTNLGIQAGLKTTITGFAKLKKGEAISMIQKRMEKRQGSSPPMVTFALNFQNSANVENLIKASASLFKTWKGFECHFRLPVVIRDDATRFTIDFFDQCDPNLGNVPLSEYLLALDQAGMVPGAYVEGSMKVVCNQLDNGTFDLQQRVEFYVYNQFLTDHGSDEFGEEYKVNDIMVFPPLVSIACPPQSILWQDSAGQVKHRKVYKPDHCTECWGPKHNKKKCIYFGYCRICLQIVKDLPNKGHKHCCTLGVDGMVKQDFIRKSYKKVVAAPPEAPPLNKEEQIRVKKSNSVIQVRLNALKQKRADAAAREEAAKKAKTKVILLIYYILMMCRNEYGMEPGTCRDEMPLMFELLIKEKYKLILKKLHKKNRKINIYCHDVMLWQPKVIPNG